MRRLSAALALVILVLLRPAGVRADEFLGPFASWANAKRDYSAVGDGKADDTAALQRALDDLGTTAHSTVLYLPAGTYRITATLKMTTRIYVSIVGEHPDRTAIRWDGPANGVMLWLNGVAYSRFGRITWDGAGNAECAIDQAWQGSISHADTGNEYADLVLKDVGFGLRVGRLGYMGSEGSVLRCRFVRCSKAGLSVQNFNALDWWVWDSLFDRCRIGATNTYGAGNFHVYDSLFRNSTEADASIGNTEFFSLRGNVSVGSRAFFKAGPIGASGMVTLQGNRVHDPIGTPIEIGDLGPLLLFDNVIRSSASPAVRVNPAGALASLGNTFTVADPISARAGAPRIDDRVVSRDAVKTALRSLPGPLPAPKRTVIELPADADVTAIQRAIDRCAALKGSRPVVHLPAGDYRIERTLAVPAGCDAQIVGDGGATRLVWAGNGPGPVVRLAGPSHATLRDLAINAGGKADGLVVEDCDQPGARVFGEQVLVNGAAQDGLRVDGLERANVEMRDFGHSGAKRVGVRVVGGPRAARGEKVEGRVAVFGGASSNNELSYDVSRGGRLLVEDMWYEGAPPRFMRCTDSGAFTLNGATIAAADPNHGGTGPDIYAVDVDGFRGDLTFLTTIFSTRIAVHGASPEANVLLLGVIGNGDRYFLQDAPAARTALRESFRYTQGGGAAALPDRGTADPAFLRRMLADVRTQRPRPLAPIRANATDVRLYRVSIDNGITDLRLTAVR